MPDPIFTEAPEEVIRHFDAKRAKPSFDWRDMAPQEHATSFTVAKSAGFDILDDIRDATRDAIANFTDYGTFVDRLMPTLQRKGWWGRQMVTDPLSGETRLAQLGSLRRLRTIYWANTKTARAAGEWERIQRTKRGLPFLIYELSGAENKRPEHEAWVGIILPVDDVWWSTHYPPNGWLCQCRVRQISRREAESSGYDPEAGGPQVVTKPWTNKRTGERFDVPEGIDPGWQTNPGINRAANMRAHLAGRMDSLSDVARNVAVRDIVGAKQFQALARAEMPYAGAADRSPTNVNAGRMALPVGVLPARIAEQLQAKTRTVLLSNADAHKQAKKRADVTPAQYALVQRAIDEGRLFEDTVSASEFILQIMHEGKPWAAVLHMTKDRREIFLKSFRRIQLRQFGETARHIGMD